LTLAWQTRDSISSQEPQQTQKDTPEQTADTMTTQELKEERDRLKNELAIVKERFSERLQRGETVSNS
jgi:hypothetical protein